MLEGIPEPDSGFLLRGGSTIISPTGKILTEPLYDAASMITATIHSREHIEARLTLDTTGHYARPDVFRLKVDERPQTSVVIKRVHE